MWTPRLPALPSLDVYRRRRLILAILIVAFVRIVLLAVNGGETSSGSPDPRAVVPADALAYAEVHLDTAREQSSAASAFAAQLPKISGQVIARVTASLPFAGAGLGTSREPWLGGEVASATLPRAQHLELLASTNDAAALRFAGALVGSAQRTNYRGTEILAGTRGSAAIVGGFLALGQDAAVRRAIDTNTGDPSLATYGPARVVLSALPSPSFAREYFSAAAKQPLGAAFGALNGPAAIAVRFTRRSVELDAHVRVDPQARQALSQLAGFDPTLAGTLAAGTLGYLGGGPLSASERIAVARLGASLPKLVSATIARFGISDPAALARELAPILGNETAVGLVSGPTPHKGQFAAPPTLGVVSKGVAAGGALRALHGLRKDVTGEVRGNRLLLAGNPPALSRLVHPRGSLASGPAFRSALSGLARRPAFEAYLDLGGLVPLFETAGLAENPAYASFAPEARRLEALGAALKPSRKALDARVRLTITGK